MVRVSGREARSIAVTVLRRGSMSAPGPMSISPSDSHRARLALAVDPRSGRPIDEVLVLPMLAPRSFTGEDVVEIHCHGGPMVVELLLGALLTAGARPARPGEFSERAFLNGRIDLCQAEAIADLVQAGSEAGARAALSQLRGRLSESIEDLQSRLTGIRALAEAHLDFPEDDLPPDALEELTRRISVTMRRLDALLSTFRRGRLARLGMRVVLVARPNAGKSSLMNALLGRDRSLVSAEPGTTRDYIEEPLAVGPLRVLLCDTAGVRVGASAVEQAGIVRTRERLEDADLALVLVDGSRALAAEDAMVLGLCAGRPSLLVRTKADLPRAWRDGDLAVLRAGAGAAPASPGDEPAPPVPVSALNHTGLLELLSRIASVQAGISGETGTSDPASLAMITRARHHEALSRAREHLIEAQAVLKSAAPLEILSSCLQSASAEIATIVGGGSTEEVLDRIFREFCIGK